MKNKDKNDDEKTHVLRLRGHEALYMLGIHGALITADDEGECTIPEKVLKAEAIRLIKLSGIEPPKDATIKQLRTGYERIYGGFMQAVFKDLREGGQGLTMKQTVSDDDDRDEELPGDRFRMN